MIISYRAWLKENLRLSFHHKKLWLLGFFISGLSFFLQFSFDDLKSSAAEALLLISRLEKLKDKVNTWPVIDLFLGLGVLVLLLSAISLIAKAGLFNAVAKIRQGESISFWSQVRFGLQKFWPMLLSQILFFIPNLIFLGLYLLVHRFFPNQIVYNIIWMFLMIYNLAILFVDYLVYCHIVNESRGVFESFANSFRVVKNNFKAVLFVALSRLITSIIALVAVFVAIPVSLLIFTILTLLFSLVTSFWFIPFLMQVLGILCALLILILAKGFRGAYQYSLLEDAYSQLK